MARTKYTPRNPPRSKRTASSAPSQSKSASASLPPSKKVRIAEPSEETATPTVQKSSTGQPKSILKDKGKAPMTSGSQPSTPAHSDSETESVSPSQIVSSSKSKPRIRGKKKGDAKQGLPIAPKGFNTSTVYITDPSNFESKLKNRPLCPAVYVDLKEIDALGFKVSEYLGHYENLIRIQDEFSPDMVRIFYNNMSSNSVTNEKGEITSYSMITRIRGVEIVITPDILNGFLGTTEYVENLTDFSEKEMHALLKPEEPFVSLSFEPSSMPPLQRIIHYIYSRCLVNKSGNYTHLAHMDYHNLSWIMNKEKRNIGELIFHEMWRFVFSGSKRITVPYPCLVTNILKQLKIWYILDKSVKPQKFGEAHLHRMNINIVDPKSQPQKKKKRTTSEASRGQDEAQSSAPPQPSSAPSYALASMQQFMETEFRRMGETFTTAFHAETQGYINNVLKAAGDYFSGKTLDIAVTSLTQSFLSFQNSITERLTSLETTVGSLDGRVASIEQFIRDHQAPPAPAPAPDPIPSPHSPDPPTDAVLAMIDFSTSGLTPEAVSQPIPAPPVSTVPPSEPSITPDVPHSSPQ